MTSVESTLSPSIAVEPTKPLVSVIMATYNCAATADEAIRSIVEQTYSSWELIVCDDGSTDDTLGVLRLWQEQLGSRMTLLSNNTNMRLQYSLNRCLRAARGTFIARMDGDDVSHPTRLERQVQALECEPSLSLVGTHMQRFSHAGLADVVRTPTHPTRRTLLTQVPFAHATILARRDVFARLGGYDESSGVNRVEDIDLWFRFYALRLKGANIPEPLYFVREDLAAIRRRTLQNRWNLLVVTLKGYRMLSYPLTAYWRPLAAFSKVLVPAAGVAIFRRLQKWLSQGRVGG
jgi:glycosyltransferase EpsE